MIENRKICKRYIISLGMNDSITYEPKAGIEQAIRIVNNCLKAYEVAFSSNVVSGGYIHENGKYILEQSVQIIIIDPPSEDIINEVSKDLCVFFNQECIFVTCDNVECFYVTESLEMNKYGVKK